MKRPLRIGVEVQRLFRAKKHGMEVVALELLKELQQIDTYNQYIIFAKEDIDLKCFEESENFKIELISASSYIEWEQFKLPKAVKKHNLDFLHSTCNTSSLKLSVPLVLTLHDIIYLEKIDFKGTAYQNFGNLYRKFIVPTVVNRSEVVITVSNFEREVIKNRLKINDEKILVIYNAVNKKFNNNYNLSDINEFKIKHKLPESFVLFLGNTAPKKNTLNLIEAFTIYCKKTTNIIPLVVLDYDKGLVEGILTKLECSEMISHFIFPGFISSNEMPLIYNAATIFVYPSLRESFGLPILEAMACNTPVITSNTSCMPEISGEAALLINPKDAEDIANSIYSLLADGNLRANLSEKGLKRAALFSWTSSAEQLLSVYNKIGAIN